jgi:hypothetical protein
VTIDLILGLAERLGPVVFQLIGMAGKKSRGEELTPEERAILRREQAAEMARLRANVNGTDADPSDGDPAPAPAP